VLNIRDYYVVKQSVNISYGIYVPNLIDTEWNFSIFILLQGQVVLLMPIDFRQQTEQRMFLHVIIHPACVSGATQIK